MWPSSWLNTPVLAQACTHDDEPPSEARPLHPHIEFDGVAIETCLYPVVLNPAASAAALAADAQPL